MPSSRFNTPASGWLALGLGAFALYAFASSVPRGDTWGIHALAYLPAHKRTWNEGEPLEVHFLPR